MIYPPSQPFPNNGLAHSFTKACGTFMSETAVIYRKKIILKKKIDDVTHTHCYLKNYVINGHN